MEVRDKNSNNDRPEDAASDSNKLRWQRSSTSTVITDQGYEEKDKRMVGVANQAVYYKVDCIEYVDRDWKNTHFRYTTCLNSIYKQCIVLLHL